MYLLRALKYQLLSSSKMDKKSGRATLIHTKFLHNGQNHKKNATFSLIDCFGAKIVTFKNFHFDHFDLVDRSLLLNFFGAKIVTDDSNSWVGMWLIFFPSNIFVIASSHPFLSALGMSRWWNSYLQHGWLLSFSIMEKKFLFLVFVISRNSNDVRLDGAVIFTKKCCSGALFIWENHDTQRKHWKTLISVACHLCLFIEPFSGVLSELVHSTGNYL